MLPPLFELIRNAMAASVAIEADRAEVEFAADISESTSKKLPLLIAEKRRNPRPPSARIRCFVYFVIRRIIASFAICV